jgi:uncharacterized protein YllA (UPF0747 family)
MVIDLKRSGWPEDPRIWKDYASGSLERLSPQTARWDTQMLKAQAALIRRNSSAPEDLLRRLEDGLGSGYARTLENLRGLRRPGTVVVAARIHACLLGGPLFQFLKCLTAVKACRELARYSIEAVPLFWVSDAPPAVFSQWSACMPDHEGELHRFSLQPPEPAPCAADPLPRDRVEALLAEIESLGRGDFDAETLETLRAAYGRGATLSSATARLFLDWMSPWGAIVLDAGAPEVKTVLEGASALLRGKVDRVETLLRAQAALLAENGYDAPAKDGALQDFPAQSCVFPVAVAVLDPGEVHSFVMALPVFEELGVSPPLACPRSRAAVVDARSRRTLVKYGLDARDLFADEGEWTEKVAGAVPCEAERKLRELGAEIELRMAELKALIPAGIGSRKMPDSCEERILYQIEKLRRHCEQAAARRLSAAERRIRRARNFLAPAGFPQERALAGIFFPLRYSRSVLGRIHDELELFQFEPRLIFMD